MKLSIVLLFTLLQCQLSSLSPIIILDYPLEQKTTTKYKDPRFERKENSYYYDYNENSTLTLTLYDEYKYKLLISTWFIETGVDIAISFGSFRINSDKSYLFSDIPTGIKFRAYKSGDSLKLAERITLMQGVTYEKCRYDLDQQCYLEGLAKIQRYKQRDRCSVVNCGVYNSLDDVVMLNLKSNNEFEFNVFDLPISSGQWRQCNAEIILSDSCLNKEMKLIVDKDHLICSFMPGFLIGTELRFKEPVKNQPIPDNATATANTNTNANTNANANANTNANTNANANRVWIYIGLIVLFSIGSLLVIYRKISK